MGLINKHNFRWMEVILKTGRSFWRRAGPLPSAHLPHLIMVRAGKRTQPRQSKVGSKITALWLFCSPAHYL
jgi:hypothetical protein